jgi:hypothetical protein
MDIPAFEDLLGRLGNELATWPAAQRAQAAELLQNSAQARALLAEAQRLRSALTVPPVRAPAGLLDRIMQQAKKRDDN